MKLILLTLLFALIFIVPFTSTRSTRKCYIGGCSGEICTYKPGVASDCIWKPQFACYKHATCTRQKNGRCGWTQTTQLKACLKNPPGPCYVGGCSSELCTDKPNAVSTCIWRDQFACYKTATCERQANGKCGWTQTAALQKCLKNPPGPCYVGGCSNEICSDKSDVVSICIWRDEFACYKGATCARQTDGKCGWTQTAELQKCLKNPPRGGCYVGGCSGQLCTEDPYAISTCEWTAAYACYKNAICDRQTNGKCGWTQTAALQKCLKNPPPLV